MEIVFIDLDIMNKFIINLYSFAFRSKSNLEEARIVEETKH